ncbi:tetratricopeptide repeat protein [Vibrio pectenicida]|uniref:Tetratricopeptide repeat protein n=1 Tax=Vibrio pectenicida TaxID=62763 RepID=A0A3R9EIR5_9VIBR|nr:tetratricopeptide repeat protein [Vibrio pectenicida]NOH71554.1 tetratricopeptide repeat protein [Vibrio pectenicida]RSD32435.1 tetratricopeptide repeat protein [Vibrio pectenicida]
MNSSFIILCFSLLMFGCQSTGTQKIDQDIQLAQTALANGHADNALVIYKQKLKQTPDDAQLLFLAGSACNQSARYDEALYYLNKGSTLAPSSEFDRELGRAHLALGNIRLAADTLHKAVENNPSDDIALNSLGVTYSLQKNYVKARSAFKGAINIRPDSLEYRNNLALGWLLDGQAEQSIQILYPIYLRGEATSKVRLNLALAYAANGKLEAAKTIAMSELNQSELESTLGYYQTLAEQGIN